MINDFEGVDKCESWIGQKGQNELPLIIWLQVIEAKHNPTVNLSRSLNDVEFPLKCDPVEEDIELRATIGVPPLRGIQFQAIPSGRDRDNIG